MNDDTLKKITRFFAEIGNLRRVRRSGFTLAGVDSPETIAEHVVRAAQIAYILAFLEEANPEKTAAMVLFHDNGEIRVGDQHKVASRYFDISEAERKAFEEQMANLPGELQKRIISLRTEHEKRQTKEGIVARDADWLETAIEAKEYEEQGFKIMRKWMANVKKALETESAKKLLEYIEKEKDFLNSWWQGLKKMTYRKLYK